MSSLLRGFHPGAKPAGEEAALMDESGELPEVGQVTQPEYVKL